MRQPTKDPIGAHAAAGALERVRLAREIHDGIAQDLAALGYRLDDLATAPGLGSKERSQIRLIRGDLSQTLQRLRRSIFDLRNGDIDLPAELREILHAIEPDGMIVRFNCTEEFTDLGAAVSRHLLAIAIEAISNVVQHSHATDLAVSLSGSLTSFSMLIEDNGIGNVRAKDFSYGLTTMAERSELIGATFEVKNAEFGGTIVQVTASPT
ncbi:MAG TPA: histidine kinase [Candidatus Nanopelagicaceae bacterium]|nr:histidine kinase [Candidatus Nanopelagicaceae bacterium]